MSTRPAEGGALHRVYRNRVGDPETDDEVRGYWVFLVGLLLATVGLLLFLPSQSAAGAEGLTLRETSIFLAAVGLSMMVAGPVIRLPLQPWANYAAYLGQVICFAAAVRFTTVFPAGWDVRTGSQPVIVLYAVGLGIIAVGGVLVPLFTGARDAQRSRSAALESTLQEVRHERDRLQQELEEARAATDESTAAGEEAAAARDALQARLDGLYASQARFELFEDAGGEYRWRLRHRNGNVIADGGEGYTRRHNALKGLQSVRQNALGATLLAVEPEAVEETAEEPFEPVAEASSRATFELYEDNAGEYRFRLRHDNGNVLADSGEGYAEQRGARRALDRLQEYAGVAQYLRFDPAGLELYRDAGGEYRWRLVHRNGNVLADSGEGYSRRRDARRAVDRLRDGLGEMSFEVYEDAGGEYRWRLEAPNGRVMADSGEGYGDRGGAEAAVDRVREHLPAANLLDIGQAAFEVYEDASGGWRWRLRHRNGNILADSGEAYGGRSNAHDAIESVKRNAPNAAVETAGE